MKQIAEILKGRPLFHAESNESVRDVARHMRDLNIGAIAVLDGGKLVGIFSERDIMARVVAEGRDPDATPISLVMTKEIIAAEPVEDVNVALQKMKTRGCRHLPIVEGGTLVGMISLRDLMQVDADATRAKASFLSELVTSSPDYET